MGFADRFALKVKRAETPFYRLLNRSARRALGANLPIPGFLKPVLRAAYELHGAVWQGGRILLVFLLWEPLFRARCASAGTRLGLALAPRITGRPVIRVGDGVRIHGKIDIIALGDPGQCELILGNGVQIGHRVTFAIARRIVIEDHAGIASECYVTDTARVAEEVLNGSRSVLPEEASPVRIGAKAWVARGCVVLKGTTVGEGAIVGAGSVVAQDIPPFSIAMGNPARVVGRQALKP
jgi:acetyltransferase-like isoleucine patch superfamily enzyme